jgi:hypothetical protein
MQRRLYSAVCGARQQSAAAGPAVDRVPRLSLVPPVGTARTGIEAREVVLRKVAERRRARVAPTTVRVLVPPRRTRKVPSRCTNKQRTDSTTDKAKSIRTVVLRSTAAQIDLKQCCTAVLVQRSRVLWPQPQGRLSTRRSVGSRPVWAVSTACDTRHVVWP